MRPRPAVGVRNGFPVFDVAADAAMFGSDDVARGLDE